MYDLVLVGNYSNGEDYDYTQQSYQHPLSRKTISMDYSTFSDLKYVRLDTEEDDEHEQHAHLDGRKKMPEDYKSWRHHNSVIRCLTKSFGLYYALIGLFEAGNIVLTFLRPALLE